MRKGVRRILACLLALLLVLPPNITALAVSAGSNPTSDGGKIPASQFNIHARGYIVTLRLVPNTVADGSEEAESIEKSGREWKGTGPVYTEAGYSTISQYYGTFPSFFTSSTIRATSALIALCDSNNKMIEFNSKDNYFIDGSGTRSKAWNRVANSDTGIQQHAVRNEAYSRGDYYPKLLGSKILADSKAFTAWQSGYKALEKYNEDYGYVKWRKANSSLIAAEAEKFLNVFKDAEDLGKNLNDMLITGSVLKDENKRWENTLRYLDILMVIDYLTGNTCHSVVQSYYENRNANGSSSFATVFIASVASHSGNEFWDWYTLPTYYAMATGRACDKYTGICIEGNDVGQGHLKMGSQTSEAKALQQKIDGLFKQYKAVCQDILGSAYQYKMNWTNSSLIWWSKNQANVTGFDNWKMATMLMPTNVYGKMYGNAGYTYFSDAFVPKPEEKEIPGTVTISCVSPQGNWQKVVEGGSVDNVFKVSLNSVKTYGVGASRINGKQVDVLNSDNCESFDVKITLTAEVSNGTCENKNFFDEVNLGDAFKKGNPEIKKSKDGKTCVIKYIGQKPESNWDGQWEDILSSKAEKKQYITVTDKVEKVTGFNLEITYAANVSIVVKTKSEDLDNHFVAAGKRILEEDTNKDAVLLNIRHSSKASTVVGTALELTPTITPPPPTDTPDPPVTGTPPTPKPSVTPTPMPTTAAGEEIMNDCFYTSIKTPVYAEMKEGTPGHETFEAMAGVPTTEDLYVGFGGSEFMLSFDGEERITKSNDNREYNLTYTCNKCGETDEPCHISCPGHTFTAAGGHMTCTSHSGKYHSHSYCSEGSITVYCSGGPQSGTVSCSCGKNVVSWEVTPVYGTGYSECTSGRDGHNCQDGLGCVHTKKVNTCHTHVHTFTGKVTQPIDKFKYFDIKALWLWQLTQCKVTGLSSFMDINELTIDPKTGYQVFCSQEDYKNNNGRLVFSFIYADKKAERFSNTSNEEKNNEVMLHTECDQAATDWMNEQIEGITTKATVISDYAVLTTTQGYQSAMYHEYDSDEVVVTDNRFTTGQDNKSIAGNKITFSEPFPTWDDLWKANGKSAHDWSDHTIVASGYNGNYSNYSTKWNHGTLFKYVDENPAEALLTDQPNMAYKKGSTSFVQAGFTNTRLTKSGLNIRDANSTVPNGAYSAKEATATYKKVVDFNSPEYGIDWAADEATAYKEIDGGSFTEVVGYSPEHEDINAIVVHTPVSSQYAVVISNDKQYDCRTDASLAEGGDPPSALNGKCPMNESCSHAVLVCDNHGELHDESCYSMVQIDTNHVGGLNAHVCDKYCNVNHTHTSECYSTTHVTSVSFPFTYGSYTVTSAYNTSFSINPNAMYTIYRHPYGCSYAGQCHLYNSSTGTCLGCSHSSCGGEVVATFRGSEFTKTVRTCGLYDAEEMKCKQCNGTGSVNLGIRNH